MAVPLARNVPAVHGLVASASKLGEGRTSGIKKRREMSWQKQAFFYTKLIPELNYASRFYAKMLSKLKIFPAYRLSNDELEPITEGPALDLLERIQDPGGGRSQILWSYGRLMFIIGECYLFGYDLGTEQEAWKIVNPAELDFDDGGKILHRPTETGEPITYSAGSAQAYRMWTPDPQRSGEAESPMRAVIEIAEELDLLTKSVKSTAVSRLLNGMYKVPSELSFGADTPGLDEDPEENPFLAMMFDHMISVVENAGSPEAAMGFLAEGAYEFLDRLEWSQLHDPQNDYLEQGLRKEAIDRAAMGLDMPPEILKGMAEANHWGARQILHDTWRSHGSVIAEQAGDDFADAYLRPALRDAEFSRWREVVIGYDDSNVVVPPDRTDDADKALDRGNVNDEGYRKMKGIPESMAPNEEEFRVYLAVKLKEPGFLKGTKWELEQEEPADQPPGPDPSSDGKPPAEETPPEPGPGGTSRRESRASAIQGAAWTALYRCRELAGSRICTTHRRAPELKAFLEEFKGKSNAEIAPALGQQRLQQLGNFDGLELVKGGADPFVIYLTDEWGFTNAQAQALSEMLLVHAARTLFDKRGPTLPSGFLAQVERMQDTSSMLSEKALVERNNEALAEVERQIAERGGPRAVHLGAEG
jgi:hypothetical protein